MRTTLFVSLILVWGNILAQEKTETVEKNRPFQISLIYPLGTNGMESGKISNNFSLNLIAGYCGGVKGTEIAGFSNFDKNDVTGIQIAGFCNTNLANMKGCQISGFSNYDKKVSTGLLIAGFANTVIDSSVSAQISGFSNVTVGSHKGFQLSGFGNYAHGDVKGTQITGFANVAKGNTEGFQLAGFTNITTKDLKGAQVSGFLNFARKLKGFQLGFINYCDSTSGVCIGFLSIVKEGYRVLEVSGDESLPVQLSIKTGTEKFYNILAVGAKPTINEIDWGWGYGIGTLVHLGQHINLNIDAMSYEIHYGEWWTNSLNLLNKLKLNVEWKLKKNIGIFGGASYNVLVAGKNDSNIPTPITDIAPWHSYKYINKKTTVLLYPGFNVGLRISLTK